MVAIFQTSEPKMSSHPGNPRKYDLKCSRHAHERQANWLKDSGQID